MLKEKLKKYGQGHVLSFYEELSQEEKDSLLNQLSGIDLKELGVASQKLSNLSNKNKYKITEFPNEKAYSFRCGMIVRSDTEDYLKLKGLWYFKYPTVLYLSVVAYAID